MSPATAAIIGLAALAHLAAAASILAPLIGRKFKGELPADVARLIR